VIGGAIYVLWWLDTLMVKRINVNFKDNTVDVISDNPRYAAETGVDPADLRIAGRVIWLGRKV
jgi:phage repressor protein C with HTH and peptisase S24 domain